MYSNWSLFLFLPSAILFLFFFRHWFGSNNDTHHNGGLESCFPHIPRGDECDFASFISWWGIPTHTNREVRAQIFLGDWSFFRRHARLFEFANQRRCCQMHTDVSKQKTRHKIAYLSPRRDPVESWRGKPTPRNRVLLPSLWHDFKILFRFSGLNQLQSAL